MDILFSCQHCKQQLEADSSMSGNSISCPNCNTSIQIPEPDPANLKSPQVASSAAGKEEKHFIVPVHDTPTESLIVKAHVPLEAAAAGRDKQVKIRSIRRSECVEVGKDHFDEVVSGVLAKIGEKDLISIHTIGYSHLDIGSRAIMADYGVLIVYKG